MAHDYIATHRSILCQLPTVATCLLRKGMKTRGDRLKHLRKKAGFRSARDAAKHFDVAVSTYNAHERAGQPGGRDFDEDDATKYARWFGGNMLWLFHGKGNAEEHIDSEDIAASLGGERAGLSATSIVDGSLKYRPTIAAAAIPELRDFPGAGEGQIGEGQVFALDVGDTVVGHEVAGEWVVPDLFLRGRLNTNPSKTIIMAVTGESMRPTLEPDDRVIVSLSEHRLGPDGVYVIAIGDHEPQVKRLIRVMIDGEFRIRVVSDNGSIANDVRPDDIRIVGRVVGRVSRM